MTNSEYLAAVKRCPRVSWVEGGFSLRTMKPTRKQRVTGYVVREDLEKVSVVADVVLTDDIAVEGLAYRSSPEHLVGVQLLPTAQIEGR